MNQFQAHIGKNGELIFPEEFHLRYGLKPGTPIHIDETGKGLRLRIPITHLSKVYIEPTNRCNLECRTCIRNVWEEPLGQMTRKTFSRIMEGLKDFSPPPTVFFGALGEPLAHPDILEMVAQAKSLNTLVELITNGTLLTRKMSKQLIEAGLDRLWVSLDGATPESYRDIRLGAMLPEVLANIKTFRDLRSSNFSPFLLSGFHMKPEIGIVFVAMKRNIHELPSLLSLAMRLGATRVLVSNVLPYTEEMSKEILYSRSLTDVLYQSSVFQLDLPKIDVDEDTKRPLYLSLHAGHSLSLVRGNFWEGNDYCPFIENGATAISWDGNLSPCLPLLHTHTNYFDKIQRYVKHYIIGNVNESSLQGLWNQPEYLSFRQRVQLFDFAPCTYCSSCSLFWENEEDCLGNTFPTCGGCLWAQGVIQCP